MNEEWLPDLLTLNESGGDWTRYLERLHQQFARDFIESLPSWPGKRVGLKRHPEYDGKSATFWHMISEGTNEVERTPDLRRCERIAWPRSIIDEFDEVPPSVATAKIVWWQEKRRSDTRYLLALDDFSYVVVVADRGNFVLPWTAYLVEHTHRRDKLRKAWQTFWASKKAEAAPKDGLVTPSTHG